MFVPRLPSSSSPHFLPPPVNALSRHSPLSVSLPDPPKFKVVDSTVVVTTTHQQDPTQVSRGRYKAAERENQSKPGKTRLSYQLSVGADGVEGSLDSPPHDHDQPEGDIPDSKEWNLYRPESPGNSPIYIAKGVFRGQPQPQAETAPTLSSRSCCSFSKTTSREGTLKLEKKSLDPLP